MGSKSKEIHTYNVLWWYKKNRFAPKGYVEELEKKRNKVEVSIFQGYQYYDHPFEIDYNRQYQISDSNEWKYYSKNPKEF